MTKSYTPPPESPRAKRRFGCGVILLLITLLMVISGAHAEWWLLLAFCIPAFVVILSWLYGKALLLAAYFTYRPHGIVGVLITSDSPNWKEYIDKKWLEPYLGRFVVLNWSKRDQWPLSLASTLYRRLLLGEELNVCPVVILLRGLRHPLLFRFFYAFRDHKHGNDNALAALETRLEQELGKVRQPRRN